MFININSDALIAHTVRLEKLSKTAMPNVVRQTLNKAALDVKQNTMPKTAKDTFEKRKPNFFSSTSTVFFARGNNISALQSMVGFKGNHQAIEDLEEQEKGGKIGGRSFIPIKSARISNSNTKLVRANAKLKALKFVDAKNAKGKNDKEKFVKSVIHAGKGGHVLADFNGKSILWRVNSIKRDAAGPFKLTALYTYEKGRDVTVKGTSFMEDASLQSAQKMEKIFNQEAEMRLLKDFK